MLEMVGCACGSLIQIHSTPIEPKANVREVFSLFLQLMLFVTFFLPFSQLAF